MDIFTTVQTSAASSVQAVVANFTMVDRVVAVLFGSELQAECHNEVDGHAWLLRVLDIQLARPTRRPFVVDARCSLTAFGNAIAGVRMTMERHTTSRQLRNKTMLPGPTGALPIKHVDHTLRLHIPRSVQPRERLRVLLLVEVHTASALADAAAVFDSCDVQAK